MVASLTDSRTSSSTAKCVAEQRSRIDACGGKGVAPATITAMLRREDELRFADETLAQLRASHAANEGRDPNAWLTVIAALQRRVSREFDVDDVVGPTLLQRAEWIFDAVGEREEIVALSSYRRFNRIRDGPLEVGDVAPLDRAYVHPLHAATGTTTGSSVPPFGPAVPFSDLVNDTRLLVAFAGSVS